jgi:bromodomain adjacent to zinc finger domain protein 1A
MSLRKPLKLAPFTIDEYENALYHSNPAQPCVLLQEIHQTLLSLIRADALTNQDLVLPLKAAVPPSTESDGDSSNESSDDDDDDDEDEDKQEKIKLVTNQAGVLAAEFDAKETNGKIGRRDSWEGMLAGCLWQVSARGRSMRCTDTVADG